MSDTPVRAAAFDQGQTPEIAVFNKAVTPLGLDLGALIVALQKFVDQHVVPVWNTPCKLIQTNAFKKGDWGFVFLDTADSPGVNGFLMTDFIYPSYFENFRKPNSTKFDHMGKVAKPFQILSGGYQIVIKNGKWTQVTATKRKKKALAKEDRRGHRSEIRTRPLAKRIRSTAKMVG